MYFIYAAVLAGVSIGAMALLSRVVANGNNWIATSEVAVNVLVVAITFGICATILLTGFGLGDLANSLPAGFAGSAATTVALVPFMVMATRAGAGRRRDQK